MTVVQATFLEKQMKNVPQKHHKRQEVRRFKINGNKMTWNTHKYSKKI